MPCTASASTVEEHSQWSHCAINCPGRCPLLFHVRDGELESVDADDEARACLRGRSMRMWVNSPDRLRWPMKRIGPRGSDEFERISWDEALETTYRRLRSIIDAYGNEAVYYAYATGQSATTDHPFRRLLSCIGGYLGSYNNYSNAQIGAMVEFMEGKSDRAKAGSDLSVAEDARLVLVFGGSPAETAQGGAVSNGVWTRMRDRVTRNGGHILVVDPRMNDSIVGHAEEWLPINPGTDAALVAALIHEIYRKGACDIEFLHRFCVGFDDETMPAAYRGKGLSYVDYLMGNGYDGVEKTPGWAEEITGVDRGTIQKVAHLIMEADPLFVMQGWGSQRHSNGEMTAGSIMMLPLVTGQIGLRGTNNGVHENVGGNLLSHLPSLENPVTASIPVFLYTEAIDHGRKMTAKRDGVRGVDALGSDIKCIINHAGNCLTNQHGDINRTHEILSDETRCEFILGIDVEFCDSSRYADILLPDLFRLEQDSVLDAGSSDYYLTAGSPAVTSRFERRSAWDVCCELARRFGVEEEFTAGRSQEGWIRALFEESRVEYPWLPSYDEVKAKGVWHRPERGASVALSAFRSDPEGHPLQTPSGKIEIFSEALVGISEMWELSEEDTITPIPTYVPDRNGQARVSERHPLVLVGFHHRGNLHSSWGNVDAIQIENPSMLWINPTDAARRGIADGDEVEVFNSFGRLRVEAKVTGRIKQGAVALPQGAWHRADMAGDRVDHGGCINTLTGSSPSPLAKGNPQHANVCQVVRVREEEGPCLG